MQRTSLSNANEILGRKDYTYLCMSVPSGFVFDYWACGPASKNANGEKFAGAYPAGFLKKWKIAFSKSMPRYREDIIHFCAGRVPKAEGITVDIDPKLECDYIANVETFKDYHPELHNKFAWSLSDSPYNEGAAKRYYNMAMLNKRKMLKSMIYVTAVGGLIGVLDQNSPAQVGLKNIKAVARIAVSSVPNTNLRIFSVFQKLFSDEKNP